LAKTLEEVRQGFGDKVSRLTFKVDGNGTVLATPVRLKPLDALHLEIPELLNPVSPKSDRQP